MNQDKCRILYVDDEPAYGRLFSRAMEDDDRFLIRTAGNGKEALHILREYPAEVVLTDILMPHMGGLDLLEEIKRNYPEIFVLILTGVDSSNNAVKAMKAGAYDYILKPLDIEMIRRQLGKILEHRRLLKEPPPTDDEFRFENMIGKDQIMFKLFEKIQQVAQSDATVLINGESGTGKELIAEAIHARSARCAKPFVRVNCAALTETLINSALFGHEKGAFTGATARKPGFFEFASGGTIFLDEIGDIPIQTQVALLRVLEVGSFQRVGGNETIHVDVRVICATNKNLACSVKDKLFREDLYYRINVVSLTAPPLRERRTDIPLLARFFLELYNKKTCKQVTGFSKQTTAILSNYQWPGNVRQLANCIEHAVVFCSGHQILPEHLSEELQAETSDDFTLTLYDSSLASAEKTLIRRVLEAKDWHLSQAAEALGIARGTLYSKMERYQIHKPD
ncbi:Two-component system response regulator protein [Citrifermentans bremense]|uniref:Two-component system response regulator protein n=1 Tax=Citrifermentans bremense TaxID=60035 RepID=A0A6S6LWD0_9BACT|nr:sigma-54 dependent transcriptional regulator [Citrifermentans bremense]BCG45759.1 Two-component system response regulator protein [Citrifermentans bremense]